MKYTGASKCDEGLVTSVITAGNERTGIRLIRRRNASGRVVSARIAPQQRENSMLIVKTSSMSRIKGLFYVNIAFSLPCSRDRNAFPPPRRTWGREINAPVHHANLPYRGVGDLSFLISRKADATSLSRSSQRCRRKSTRRRERKETTRRYPPPCLSPSAALNRQRSFFSAARSRT